jgi:HAD superfamily hydrolase (TIGR01509 family)
LTQLQTAGYPLGVASASDRAWVVRWLAKFDLLPYFETITTIDDVTHNKPAPDIYLMAAAKFGVEPTRCLVFEDSPTGIQAAKAAGMTVVAVPNIATKNLYLNQADAIVPGLQNVTIDWIEALASGQE